MDKVSVIIPTIQKNTKVLAKLANSLSADEVVDEILIINNIEKELKTNIPKVKILQQEKNLYVNASWNLGISCIKNNIFLIINDDILPCPNYCSLIYNSGILNREDTGLVGINNAFINQMPKDIEDLQELYSRNATMFNFLNSQSKTTRANLSSVSGLDSSKFSPMFNKLVARKFIRLSMDNVYPTDKFRKAFNTIDRSFTSDTGSLIDKNIEEESTGVVFLNDLE
jgi:glycosyltransferase involved in cell wall biosynthesis